MLQIELQAPPLAPPREGPMNFNNLDVYKCALDHLKLVSVSIAKHWKGRGRFKGSTFQQPLFSDRKNRWFISILQDGV